MTFPVKKPRKKGEEKLGKYLGIFPLPSRESENLEGRKKDPIFPRTKKKKEREPSFEKLKGEGEHGTLKKKEHTTGKVETSQPRKERERGNVPRKLRKPRVNRKGEKAARGERERPTPRRREKKGEKGVSSLEPL